jgi:glycosyltransferase involved in cell wall biosynthesis
MKIAHVLTRGDVLGGAQTHVRELSLELRKLGHEVTVITGAPGVFTDQLRASGIPSLQVKSLVRPVRPHRDLAALIELSLALRHLKPDLVCAHTAKAGSLARAAARLQHIPSVFTPHGWSMLDRTASITNPFYHWAESLAGKLGARVINVCEYERAVAEHYGVSPSRSLEVVHNGIAESNLVRKRPVEADPPVIVMVARFAAQKDHATLLEALSGLQNLRWRLLLVGDGELQTRVSHHIAALGLTKRVTILPAETNVSRLLMASQIFVLSTHFEALPISILEAMRAGLPVIATNVGGVAESVHHKETGLLVNHADAAGLQEALATLITNPDLRLKMGNAGHRLWKAQFTASTMAARTVEVYQRALARN